MIILFQKFIYASDMMANPRVLYLMGDNEQRKGRGGQAREMRDQPNVHGIRTKKAPLRESHVYWSDDDFSRQCELVDEDFRTLVSRWEMDSDYPVVCPLDGLGTGESQLPTRAPRTLRYINEWISTLHGKDLPRGFGHV